MDISLAKVLFELGLVGERTVVEAAVDTLEDGGDSPSLRLLAGLGPCGLAKTRDLLGKTADDLQLPVPDELSRYDSGLHGDPIPARVKGASVDSGGQ
jgi:hypothetical protein